MKGRVEKRFQARKLRAFVIRHPLGHLCGYVEIPKGHPAHGVAVGVMGRISPDITYAGDGIIPGRWLVGFYTEYPQPVYRVVERVSALAEIINEIGGA